jgi:hypothetical protein
MPANEFRRTPKECAGREIDAVPPKRTRVAANEWRFSEVWLRQTPGRGPPTMVWPAKVDSESVWLESVCHQKGPRGTADAVPPQKMRFSPGSHDWAGPLEMGSVDGKKKRSASHA